MSSFSNRSGCRSRQLEATENDLKNPRDLLPLPLPPPRSPLISIQDPSQIAPDLKPTPKSAPATPARGGFRVSGANSNSGVAVRERSSSFRVTKGAIDTKALEPVHLQHFELHEDPSFWNDHNVQVLIRVRPMNSTESTLQGNRRCLVQESSQTITWTGHPETRFTFDHVACETISQEKLFRVVGLPMVENCMSGYNSCMFAYGQTGSGKTYTMMGEIHEMDNVLSEDCGMTPRIFEYLFRRIKQEEEARKDELLRYSCKCSFLEIYNEQITDLLEPSSTNLQMREDLKKGVYVENLKEYEVSSVKNVLQLLLKGAANRKIAATHMNRESSRSHCVFTCVIESQWESDSLLHLRFGRLNLVDLAGSERQKSSGAEGERLKEAANINRSLSTLGLVIMTLVDIANGKNRHVPYRDSKLTFLLQDSLGGNSKTTIIANISPSICSAGETFSTLKFAQRAKLIQNNAKVNEDASGDMVALQQQVQKLKDQVTFLIKHQNIQKSLCRLPPTGEQANLQDFCDGGCSAQGSDPDTGGVLNQKIEFLEAALIGALRREKMAEATIRRLEAEVEHVNCLVHQRDDDAQHIKTMLRFREDKIKRLEMLADDLMSSDGYLKEENIALSEENQLLRTRIERNPEITQFALENMRLLDQLRVFQDFYQHGERETLLAEVSHLRNQLLQVFEGKHSQDDEAIKELENCHAQLNACLENNAKLTREVDDLKCKLKCYMGYRESSVGNGDLAWSDGNLTGGGVSYRLSDGVQLKNTHLVSRDFVPLQFRSSQKDMAEFMAKASQSQAAQLTMELESLKKEKLFSTEQSGEKEQNRTEFLERPQSHHWMFEENGRAVDVTHLHGEEMANEEHNENLELFQELERKQKDFEEAGNFNKKHYEPGLVCVHKQIKEEAIQAILSLQEAVDELQQEINTKNADQFTVTLQPSVLRAKHEELHQILCFLMQENAELSDIVAAKDAEITAVSAEWEKAIVDLTSFIVDGYQSLEDAHDHIGSFVDSFPQSHSLVNDHVERAVKVIFEKETLISNLQRRLEDAQKMGLDMQSKLDSLRGAIRAITEVQQLENDESSRDLVHLRTLECEKLFNARELENTITGKEGHTVGEENDYFTKSSTIKSQDGAECLHGVVVEKLDNELANESSEFKNPNQIDSDLIIHENEAVPMDAKAKYVETEAYGGCLPAEIESEMEGSAVSTEGNPCKLGQTNIHVEMSQQDIFISNNVGEDAFAADVDSFHSAPVSDFDSASLDVMILSQGLRTDHPTNEKSKELNKQKEDSPPGRCEKSWSLGAHEFCGSFDSILMQNIKEGLTKTNETLNIVRAYFNLLLVQSGKLTNQEQEISAKSDASFVVSGIPEFQKYVVPDDQLMSFPMDEAGKAINSLMEINSQLNMLVNGQGGLKSSFEHESYYDEKAVIEADNLLVANKHLSAQSEEPPVKFTELGCLMTREISDIGSSDATVDCEVKTNLAAELLLKYEKVREIIEEADVMINALLKANEDAKQEKNQWRQVSVQLLVERDLLADSLRQLETSTLSQEREFQILVNQIGASFKEIVASTYSLGESIKETQVSTSETLECCYTSIHSTGQELPQCNKTSGSWQEDMLGEIMEQFFIFFVISQCHVRALVEQNMRLSIDSDSFQYSCLEPYSHFSNGEMQPNTSKDNQVGTEAMNSLKSICNLQRDIIFSSGNGTVVPDLLEVPQGSVEAGSLVGDEKILYQEAFQKISHFEEKTHLFRKNCAGNMRQLDLERDTSSMEKAPAWRDDVMQGLLFDIRLLQESKSSAMDLKDETDKLFLALYQVQRELAMKNEQFDDFLVQQRTLEAHLVETETMLSSSRSELQEAQETLTKLSHENSELRRLLEDAYFNKSQADELLEDGKKVIEGLEREILSINASIEEKILSSVEEIKNELRRVSSERDHLQAEIVSLNDKLDMASALADENEAVAVEARQIAEASKSYAEEKEEEVKVLEHSIDELEATINLLERKVQELQEETISHQLMRRELELKVQALTQRVLMLEGVAGNFIAEESSIRHSDDGTLGLSEALKRIKDLEMEIAYNEAEIKQYRDHISELLLHSEAQSSLYQEKFKELETMISDVKTDHRPYNIAAPVGNMSDKTSVRTRASGSPFRCISYLVQQMNCEKDQELSIARLRIEELEVLASKRQKEICMLNARLAAVDSMTHDVIRELLGVKLDMTNYANIIDQDQIMKLVDNAKQQAEERDAKEDEILNLRKQMGNFIKERESWMEEINKRKGEVLACRLKAERLQQRDQLLTAQNEMLKLDKANLHRKIAELDETVRKLAESQSIYGQIENPIMDTISTSIHGDVTSQRRAQPHMLLSRASKSQFHQT